MRRPVVAIVGRPNVGKSSLLNALVGRRVSIVDPTPGVTRDRVVSEFSHGDRRIEVVDTGGLGIVDRTDLKEHVEVQINAAIAGSDLVIFLVAVDEGRAALDGDVADLLRRSGKPVLLVANKVDHERLEAEANEFCELGLGSPMTIAARFGIGIDELMDAIVERLPPRSAAEDTENEGAMLMAIVGQRNSGKSTLTNAILGEDRVIVSEIPGTTRDAIDVRVERDHRKLVLIDTAGARKESRLADSIEFYSQIRSREAVERCQVAILLIDATKEISQVDKTVAEWILTHRKPCVLAINKWDLAEHIDTRDYLKYLAERLPLFHYAPVVFVSATQHARVDELINVAFSIHEKAGRRVGTPEFNRVLKKAVEVRGPRLTHGRHAKIFYGTQVSTYPPYFVLFVNDPELFREDYRRYLENRFRVEFGFEEVPVRVSFRKRQSVQPTLD